MQNEYDGQRRRRVVPVGVDHAVADFRAAARRSRSCLTLLDQPAVGYDAVRAGQPRTSCTRARPGITPGLQGGHRGDAGQPCRDSGSEECAAGEHAQRTTAATMATTARTPMTISSGRAHLANGISSPSPLHSGGFRRNAFRCRKPLVHPCHRTYLFRDQVSRLSDVVYFETAFSSVRAWSIWSYAYVTMAAVVIASPSWASDS